MVKNILLFFIALYQKTLSNYLGGKCRFYPSCSEYAKQTIIKNGVCKGLLKSVWRILRCNPLNKGGIDYP